MLLRERVEGNINLPVIGMGKADQLIPFLLRKVHGFGPGGKTLEAGKDRVRAVAERRPSRIGAAGRSEEFWVCCCLHEGGSVVRNCDQPGMYRVGN